MKIVVYYEHPDEQAIAERIVPDVAALAKFATDAISPRACPVTAQAGYSWPATSIDEPWWGGTVVVGGGGGGGNGPRAGDPANAVFLAEHEGQQYYYHGRSNGPNYCARHGVGYIGASCPRCMLSMMGDVL